MPMLDTLLLDQTKWDLVLDANLNIAVGAPPYALAQDVASAARTFKGECYYNTDLGIAFFSSAPSALVQAFNSQALTVPGVQTVQTNIDSYDADGLLQGQIIFTDESGVTSNVSI